MNNGTYPTGFFQEVQTQHTPFLTLNYKKGILSSSCDQIIETTNSLSLSVYCCCYFIATALSLSFLHATDLFLCGLSVGVHPDSISSQNITH